MDQRITDAMLATGFENGEPFASEGQVREYFTVANMEAMFGVEDGSRLSQAELDAMADVIIETRTHCTF